MKNESILSWRSKRVRRALVIVIVGIVGLYVLLPKLKGLGLNGRLELPLHWSFMAAALCSFLLTFTVSTISYKILAFHKLKFTRTFLVQFAGIPLSLILPAGLSNLSVNFLFLRSNQHSDVESGLVLGINNAIGVIANLSVLGLVIAFFGLSQSEQRLYLKHQELLILGAVLVISLITAFVFFSGRIKKLQRFRRQLVDSFKSYRRRPFSLLGAYLCAAAQAASTVFALWLVLRAYGIDLHYPIAFLIFSFSLLIGASVPTPGGLGGVEASLIAGIMATRLTSTGTAFASVLAYRALTYWIPLIFGVVALFIIERRKIIVLSSKD